MSIHEPDLKVRMRVAQWPDDAPRGAVAQFCRRHGVSRAWFYKVLAKARAEGTWAATEVGSNRPLTSPCRTPPEIAELAVKIRTELEQKGLDAGPLSVGALMRRRGLPAPSRATLARIFARAGVVVPAPDKKPRSAYKRFVAPAPNDLWQIDATEWPLANGRKATVFQVIDDHSRLALASLAAWGETSEAALRVVQTAIARHGAPRRFLSDNGLALNPSRRGYHGALVAYLESLGVTPITGKPYKPTTQGKNERFHGTLFKYLSAQDPAAATLAQLQAQIDAFDQYYNTEREHQAHGTLRLTPQEAWDRTPKAAAPEPPQPTADALNGREATIRTGSRPKGVVTVFNCHFLLGAAWAGKEVRVLHDHRTIAFYDEEGTEILSHPRPPRGTRFVPRSGLKRPAPDQPSTDS
jgi:transposase InsO family protein